MGSIQDTYLRELELLFDVRNGCLALEAEEGANDQLGVDRVCPHHLTADAKEGTNLAGRQLTDPGEREKGEDRNGDKVRMGMETGWEWESV